MPGIGGAPGGVQPRGAAFGTFAAQPAKGPLRSNARPQYDARGFAPGASLEPLLDVENHASADDTYTRLRESRESQSSQEAFPDTDRLAALALSMHRAPRRCDSERPRQYVPRNPYATPAAFPASPAQTFEDARVFEKLGTDTLFFIFYYQQGTYQQYLAARESELKKTVLAVP